MWHIQFISWELARLAIAAGVGAAIGFERATSDAYGTANRSSYTWTFIIALH